MLKYGLLLLLLVNQAWASSNLQTVSAVDIKRYMGTWFEIARTPNMYQKNCVGEVKATYTLLANNQVGGLNVCRKANGELYKISTIGQIQDTTNSKISFKITSSWLRFIPMIRADYWIIDLADDYSYAAIATPDAKNLWIVARQPTLAESSYQQIVQRVAKLGLKTEQLVKNK